MNRPSGSLTLGVLLGLALLQGDAGALTLAQVDKDFADAAAALEKTTVLVQAQGRAEGLLASSGALIHAEGYILSDADAALLRIEAGRKVHAGKAQVRFADGTTTTARVLHRDEDTDSCLLKIEGKIPAVKPASVGSSDLIGVGSWTLVCGNAFGTANEGRPAVSVGVVSAARARDPASGAGRHETLYTSAAVSPGSNGGPCVDAEGRLVGVVSTWEADPNSPVHDFGRVIPVNRIRKAYQDLPDAAKVFPDPKSLPPRAKSAAYLEESFRIVADRVWPAVVSLAVTRQGSPQRTELMRQGNQALTVPRYGGPASGILYDAEGHVLTAAANLWAYASIRSVAVVLPDRRVFPAKILARDLVRGIALLKIDGKDLPCLLPAPAESLQVGRFAFAVGNPWAGRSDFGPLLTMGVVSALHQLDTHRDAVQTDAGMTDANVGGPLVDLRGRLIGISTLQNPEVYGRNSGIGFAIPVATIEATLPGLKQGLSVLPGFLGIQLLDAGNRIQIQGVTPGSPADKGGLVAGDLVTCFSGIAPKHSAHLRELIAALQAGDEVEVEVLRQGKSRTVHVTLGERPGE